MRPCTDESLLCGILCDLRVATHAEDDIYYALGMDADQFAERAPVTTLRPDDKLCFTYFKTDNHRDIPFLLLPFHHIYALRLVFIRNRGKLNFIHQFVKTRQGALCFQTFSLDSLLTSK